MSVEPGQKRVEWIDLQGELPGNVLEVDVPEAGFDVPEFTENILFRGMGGGFRCACQHRAFIIKKLLPCVVIYFFLAHAPFVGRSLLGWANLLCERSLSLFLGVYWGSIALTVCQVAVVLGVVAFFIQGIWLFAKKNPKIEYCLLRLEQAGIISSS